MIRVLLVDDQAVVRRGLCVRFHLEPDLQVVGEASTGREALTLAQTLTPDVVLMDIEMPGMDGITATRRLIKTHPEARVIIVTDYGDKPLRAAARASGACGYVLKENLIEVRRWLEASP